MFGNWKQKYENLKEIKEMRISSLETEVNRLNDKIRTLCMTDKDNSSFVIDWDTMDAFAVERVPDAAYGMRTTIGYRHESEDGVIQIREWSLYCNTLVHNKLAEEFREYLERKKKE